MLMICKFAKTCTETKPCHHDKPHEETGTCHYPVSCGGECIPYVPASEPIALTGHAKYCRLSKQPGGLCGHAQREDFDFCCQRGAYHEVICDDWEVCPISKQQLPVELPKDPLEELVELEYAKVFCACMEDSHATNKQNLREFAEKVRALK